jgi:DNA processing protein
LVETTQDILDELHWGTATPTSTTATVQTRPDDTPEDPLLVALGWTATTLDALQARTGWPTAELSIRLLELELSNQVVRLPGQWFQRQSSA